MMVVKIGIIKLELSCGEFDGFCSSKRPIVVIEVFPFLQLHLEFARFFLQ